MNIRLLLKTGNIVRIESYKQVIHIAKLVDLEVRRYLIKQKRFLQEKFSERFLIIKREY